jgi:MerR family transcriptional regulator, light-induced transcriptional regulator
LLDFVDHCLDTGSSVETIYVDLLAPAARRLGEYWEDDSEDFVGVTMGLWRIQEILRELTLRIPPKSKPGHGLRSALFSSMPGEQHSFGTLMVAECFQRAGWDTDVLIEPSQSELNEKYASRHYDLIGLTVSCDCSTATLNSLVKTIKSVSKNPLIRIMLGGRVINEQPELVEKCGADATAIDALSAVAMGDNLVPVKSECLENLR